MKHFVNNNDGYETEYIKINYGMEFPLEKINVDEIVYIVDYSILPEEMDKLLDKSDGVRITEDDELEQKVKFLVQENRVLVQENDTLRNTNNTLHESIDKMREQHDKTLKKYNDGLAEIIKLKAEYKDLIVSAGKIKKEYADKSRLLLKQLNNQKK